MHFSSRYCGHCRKLGEKVDGRELDITVFSGLCFNPITCPALKILVRFGLASRMYSLWMECLY